MILQQHLESFQMHLLVLWLLLKIWCLVATVSRVSTIFDGLETKLDSLHQKIDRFTGMMDEIMMEKFGNFDNPVNPPKQPVPFHIKTKDC